MSRRCTFSFLHLLIAICCDDGKVQFVACADFSALTLFLSALWANGQIFVRQLL